MIEGVETWALVVMLLAGCVLLVGAVLDQEWLWAAAWTVATVLVGGALQRRREHSA